MPANLLSLAEAAKCLRVSYARATDLARHGVIPVVRLGRQVRVNPTDLQSFISNGGKALPGGWRLKTKNPEGK